MLAKKNPISLPDAAKSLVKTGDYFQAAVDNGQVVLVPVDLPSLDSIWDHLEGLGIAQQDVADAVAFARGQTAKA
jgi:hypothetical protein